MEELKETLEEHQHKALSPEMLKMKELATEMARDHLANAERIAKRVLFAYLLPLAVSTRAEL